MKRFTFSTADLLTGFRANMPVSRTFHDKDAANTIEDFHLDFNIKDSFVKLLLYAFSIAAVFAVPQLLVLAKASKPSGAPTDSWTGVSIYIIVIVMSLMLGGLSTMKDAFKLR